MSKKISVIVPVYNVKDYLEKCVDSILAQTYKDIEIILVDDGSTDDSGVLCDVISHKDERIKVLHKPNGGLSDARNAGMDIATGDYIGFVDSDDYVADDMYETLINAIEKYDADVSCCRFTKFWEDGKTQNIGDDNIVYEFDGTEALKEYLLGKTLDPFAWNKLYKRELVSDIRFIKGIIGEDNPFCIEVFKRAKKSVVVGKSKYFYLQKRAGAITNSGVTQRHIDAIFRWNDFREDMAQNFPELEKYALRRQLLFYVGLYNSTYNDPKLKEQAKKVRAFVKDHLKEIRRSDICEKTVKYSCLLLAKTPHLYNVFMKLYKKMVGEAKL